ncbi:MAG: domain S-box protein [Flavisolibacter sp.]|nr:domain S-box protein [Flavisolibacter sp.]
MIDSKLFEARPGISVVVLPDPPTFTVIAVSDDFVRATRIPREEIIGKGHFELFPESPDDPDFTGEQNLRDSFAYILQHKKPHLLAQQRYDIPNGDGTFTEKYWKAFNVPVLDDGGELSYIIHTSEDVTPLVKAKKREEGISGIEKAYNLFMNAPVIIGILKGEDYIIELANEGLLEVWGRTAEIIGKPLLTAIPELEAQGLITLLDQVCKTGEPFYAYQFPITLNRHGKEEVLYFDLVYKAIYEDGINKKASGVISVGHDVTAKVIARQKEQESEAKYRSLFESMDQGFCVLEMIFDESNQPVDYRFLETNSVFEMQTGLKNAVGKRVRELVPNLESRWFELYGKVARTGEAIRFVEGAEAMGRWFEVYAYRSGGEESKKVAVLFTDITEQKKRDEMIRESEERFRSLADESPMFVFIIDADSSAPISYWNKTWLQYTGQTVEEALGRAWDGIIHSEDVAVVMEHYVPAFKEERPYFIPSVRVKRHDNEYRWHAFKGNPRYLTNGEFNGYVGVGFDIHEQKLAEEALKQSEARTRLAVETAQLGTFEIDVAAQTIIYSARAAEIFGLDRTKPWPYTAFINSIHPDDILIRKRAHEAALRTSELIYETRIILPDHSIHWIRLNGRYFDKGSATNTLIGTVMDITKEKKAAEMMEQKIEERTRELKQVNEQLKQFAYSASHDLQEPLRKISYFLDLLLLNLGSSLSEENKKVAERIQYTTRRMRLLIDDLLSYSNTTLGVRKTEEVALNEIVKEVLGDMEATLLEQDATIDLRQLPAVSGDHRQLRQLMQNLISNAVKYHKKGVSPHVTITSRTIQGKDSKANMAPGTNGQSFHLITVKDNGIGFDPDNAERIFGLFQRLHARVEYEGTGVGLAIVQKVVENHHGYIWAEGEPGVGASFNVLLPT